MAKPLQADLSRGFSQLAAELVALDQWIDSSQAEIIGAVTTGNIWQFGVLLMKNMYSNKLQR